jgi:hypothetical protein
MHSMIKKILQYERKKLKLQIYAGVITVLVVLPAVWLAALVADMVFAFSTNSRWGIFILCVLISVTLIGRLLVYPLVRFFLLSPKKDLSSPALEIGMRYEGIRDKLVNTYQLLTQNGERFSEQLRLEAITRFTDSVNKMDFRKTVTFKQYLFSIPALIILLGAHLFLYYSFNERLNISFARIINPSSHISLLPAGRLLVAPGDTSIVLGNDLTIMAASDFPNIMKCNLRYKPELGSEYEQFALNYQDGVYQGMLKNLRYSTFYQVAAKVENKFNQTEMIMSPHYKATVLIPPLIKELKVKIDPPLYTGLETEYLENNLGTIIAYPGSKVNIRATVNKAIDTAVIQFSDGMTIDPIIKGKIIEASFPVLKPLNYLIKMKDFKGLQNPDPIEYSITLLDDQFPYIRIIAPGEDIEIASDAAFNLFTEAEDDFGITHLSLYYQIISSITSARDTTWKQIVLKDAFGSEKYIQHNYTWDFQYLPVSFEDLVHYYVEIKDNDLVNGPKKGRSQVYTIFFPTIDQMLSEFEQDQNEGIEELKEISQRNDELEEEIGKINRELKREKSINWEKKQEIENLLQQQEELQKRIEDIQNNLNQALRKLEQNDLISPDILEKYQKLQALFQDIATPELLKVMEEIQQALQKLDKKKLDALMNTYKIDQEILKENIERTLELFQKIRKEQQYDAAMELAKKIAEEQNEISNQIEKDQSASMDKKEIEQKQSVQKENLSSLDQSVKNLSQKDFPQLEAVSSYIEDEAIAEKMDQVIAFLATDGKMSAGEMSKDIASDMDAIYYQMQRLRMKMLADDKERLLNKMVQITQDLITLSFEEEVLKNQSTDLSNYSDKYIAISQRQQELNDNLRQVASALVELSHETFFISPELSRHIGAAYGQMAQSINALEERNQRMATAKQKNAMASLNAAVLSLQSAMQMMASSGSTSGFDYFLKQMQKMAGQQGQLNEASLNFLQGKNNQGSLSSEQLAELARLAAEQHRIRESLEALSKEMGNRSDIPGRLDDMVQEMEKVEKELDRLKIDRQTIARQERILRRMLDAQKSVHEREYSQKREAETGKSYSIKTPDRNQKASDELLERIEIEKQQALREGYSHDYEKLIEVYFKKLSEASTDD